MEGEIELLQNTATALKGEWGIQVPEFLTEEAILNMLTMRIADIIKQGPDTFYQLMYRLDISERKLHEISAREDAAAQIARLVYDRQLEKIKSRLQHRQSRSDNDPDLAW
jgi:hypothetical protein